MGWQAGAVLLGLALLACSSQGGAAPVQATASPTESSTPTALPTRTPAPTRTANPRTLRYEAASLCETAFSASVTSRSFSAPLISMLEKTYATDPNWTYQDLVPFYTALSPEEVRSVLCIQESQDRTGTYDDGDAAYRYTWTLRVVEWPDGTVVAAQTFRGSEAPYIKMGSGPGYGSSPTNELFGWLTKIVQVENVFFIGENVSALAVSPDGQQLYAARSRRTNVTYPFINFPATIVALDLATGATLFSLSGHPDTINALIVSPDGRLLASSATNFSSFNKTEVRVWDLQRRQLLRTYPMDAPVSGMAFSADGKSLVIASGGKALWVDMGSGQVSTPLDVYAIRVAFLPDGSLVITTDDSAVIVDATGSQVIRTMETGWLPAMSLDGRTLLARTGLVWDTESGTQTTSVPVTLSDPPVLSFDGSLLAVGNDNGQIDVWNTLTGSLFAHFGVESQVISALALFREAGFLATGTANGFVKVWALP